MQTCTCAQCGKAFELPAWAVKAGRGTYCSRVCYGASRIGRKRPDLLRRVTKACVVCGKEFETGGRAGSIAKEMCSLDCQQLARYRRGKKCAELAPLDAAYLAGFWDGEGSFMIHGRNNQGGSISFRAAAIGTKEMVIRWIKEVTGVGTVVFQPTTNPKWADRWVWWVNGDGAESFTRQLLPYLKLKQEQAQLGADFQERLRDPKLKADRTWQQEWRERMQAMNRRGPVAVEETVDA